MKERPILFSAPMVRAILEGRKTQTRRIVKFPVGQATHDDWLEAHEIATGEYIFWSGPEPVNPDFTRSVYKPGDGILCPYGQPGDNQWYSGMPPCDGWYYVQGEFNGKAVYLRPVPSGTYPDIEGDFITWGWDESDDPEDLSFDGGPVPETIRWKRAGDRLWVRETFAYFEGDSPNDFETGDGWIYRASVPPEHDDGIRWRPSIHMPRAASRILLEITDVRVERLQEITRSDIRSEGLVCPDEFKSDDLEYNYRHWYPDAFKSLWDGIYGPGAYASNPWVWVRTFKKIQP